jgi:adenine-specific DNA glycosylase
MVERAHKRFFDRFPTFESLAEANVRTITRALKGVGLSRVKAKRLKRLAQEILRIGELPSTRDGLVRLPGVGRYTASIVSCLTFGRPVVAVDVNVIRILKRMGFIEREEEAEPFLEGALDEDQRRWFNKALLEFGMSICRPKPRCERCPMVDICSFEPLKPT